MRSPFDQQSDGFETDRTARHFINIRQFWTPIEIAAGVLMLIASIVFLGMQVWLKGLGSLSGDLLLLAILMPAAMPIEKYFLAKMDVLITDEGIRVGQGTSSWLAPLWQNGFRAWSSIHRAEWVWGSLPRHNDLFALKSDAPDLLVRLADYLPAGASRQEVAAHRAMLKKRYARNWFGRYANDVPQIEALPLFKRIQPALHAHDVQINQVSRLLLSKQVDLTASREGKRVLALMGGLGVFVVLELVMRLTKTDPVLWWYSLPAAVAIAGAGLVYLRKGRMPYPEAIGVSLVLFVVAIPAVHEGEEHLNMWTDRRPSADMAFRYIGASTLEPVAGNQAPSCVPEPLVADGYAAYWETQEIGAMTKLPVYCGLGFWQIDIKPLAALVHS